MSRHVAAIQRVPRVLAGTWVAGCCEFCPWIGDHYPKYPGSSHNDLADQDSREHLAEQHPEKVTYWEPQP